MTVISLLVHSCNHFVFQTFGVIIESILLGLTFVSDKFFIGLTRPSGIQKVMYMLIMYFYTCYCEREDKVRKRKREREREKERERERVE